MSLTLTIGACAFTLILVYFIQWKRKCNRMPPGPTPLPVIGNMHQIDDSVMVHELTKIGRMYGDIFSVHFLTQPVVVINSFNVIKELLESNQFCETFGGRVSNYFSKHLLPDDLIFQTATDSQQYMRKLAMKGVKQYGTALKRVEQIAQEELVDMMERIKMRNGAGFDLLDDITLYTSNIILVLVCGERFHANHKIMRAAREVAADFEYLLNYQRQVLIDVPFSTMVHPGLKKACQRMTQNYHLFTEYCAEIRKEAKTNHSDCLFATLEREYKEGKITFNNVKGLTVDMIIAGIFTSTPTIYAALLVLVHFPEVQKKIQEEIQRVVGDDRLPCLDDKPNLPYSHATMLETFRYFAPSPLPGPRKTIRECTYRGYTIPNDCMVMYNVWQVHHDETFWDKPYTFDPTRFLDSDGNLVSPEDERRQKLLTFGVGKRSCVGDILARTRIFLLMTTILQRFDLKEDPASPCPSHDPRTFRLSFMTRPPQYKMCCVPRL